MDTVMQSDKLDMTEAEWQARCDLAALYRITDHFGWTDTIDTHMTVRIPGEPKCFLINNYGDLFDEITASSLVKMDIDGNVYAKDGKFNAAGFTIHSAIHMARDDAQAVMHVHTKAGQAVAAQADGLLPITQTAMLIRDEVTYHEYEGVATDLEERERLVADMGPVKRAMILRNHGTLAVGNTVAECFINLYFLERACEAQVMALSAGPGGLYNPPQGTPEKASEQGKMGLGVVADRLAWPALLRKLDRIDPSYRN